MCSTYRGQADIIKRGIPNPLKESRRIVEGARLRRKFEVTHRHASTELRVRPHRQRELRGDPRPERWRPSRILRLLAAPLPSSLLFHIVGVLSRTTRVVLC